MFTLIRPLSALAMALLALLAAEAYVPLYAEDANLGRFNLWLAGIAAVVGYGFLGARVGRGPLLAAFYAVQAAVLTAVVAAMVFAVRMVFIYGFRRIYREPMDAVNGFFDHVLRYLSLAIEARFLLTVGVGAAVSGIVLYLLFRILERRRLAR